MPNKSLVKLKTFRCGDPRKRGEGLRIGVVRYPPHGVKKKDYRKFDFFDVWFPSVAPSRKVLKIFKKKELNKNTWARFEKRYRNELNKNGESRQAVHLLAEIAKKMPVSIGCYCEDERYCHRSILKKVIKRVGRGYGII